MQVSTPTPLKAFIISTQHQIENTLEMSAHHHPKM